MQNRAMQLLAHRALALLLVAASGVGRAAGGTPPTPIPWPHPGELARYHSCGCGDACWVAEVVDRKTTRVKARLRCDCEALRFNATPADAAKEVELGRCDALNDRADKPDAIRARLEALVPRARR